MKRGRVRKRVRGLKIRKREIFKKRKEMAVGDSRWKERQWKAEEDWGKKRKKKLKENFIILFNLGQNLTSSESSPVK